jgi:hypothetical protein
MSLYADSSDVELRQRHENYPVQPLVEAERSDSDHRPIEVNAI